MKISGIDKKNINDENFIEIVKDIYTESTLLFSSFVKAKPDNDDLLMAVAALPEEAKNRFHHRAQRTNRN